MKYLKFRYIFTLAIVLVLGVSLSVYFFGGLKATVLDSKNMKFDITGYIDYSVYDRTGAYTVTFDSEAELNATLVGVDPVSYRDIVVDASKGIYKVTFQLNQNRIVAQNERYTMYLNEHTTVVSVVENLTCAAPTETTVTGFYNINKSSCTTVYNSALSSGDNEERSNFVLKYVGSNDKISIRGFNTYQHSVLYEDKLANTITRKYQINFNVENGIEILYQIGEFSVINSYYPKYYTRDDMEDQFRGNLLFYIQPVTSNQFIYRDEAYTWSAECAAYLEENDLAKVTPEIHTFSGVDEYGNKIPSRWKINDILEIDDEGRKLNKLKLQIGVHYNAADITAEDASPCTANPFSNFWIYNNLANNYYRMWAGDPKQETPYRTNFNLNLENSSPTFQLWDGMIYNNYLKLFEIMYKTDNESADFLNDRNYYYENTRTVTISTLEDIDEYSKYFDDLSIGQRIVVKIPILYKENPYNDDPGVLVPAGGFQARDEEGNFLFDDDGKPIQEVYTQDLASIQNEKNIALNLDAVEVTPPVFRVAMRFTLSDQGLDATILNDSLIEGLGVNYKEDGKSTPYSHDCLLGNIDILPYFTANNSATSKGQIIIPDGSGAIMSFNSIKHILEYPFITKNIYGPNKAFTFQRATETAFNESLMFGMYGFLDYTQQKGVLAIADVGGSATQIFANYKRPDQIKSMNRAHFRSIFRESETVYIGSSNVPFVKWAKDHANTDFSYKFHFLTPDEFIDGDNIQYVTLAQKYREYLVDKYNLTPKDKTSNNVVSINFLGAFEKKELSFGFAHTVDYSLTTFAQAESIIKEFQAEEINDFSVSYTSWTNDAMEQQATSTVKVSNVLGKVNGLKNFNEFLKANNIDLFPQVLVTTTKGYNYNFGDLKYTAKSISGVYSKHRQYVLATNAANSTVEAISMVSPKFYNNLLSKYMSSFNRLDIDGGFYSDLGNTRIGDFARSMSISAEKGTDYQIDALALAKEKTSKIMLSAPYDYAFQFVDFAVDIPLQSTLLKSYDYSIPFYQLVVSGLFDYSGPAVNYDSVNSSEWYLLKALETGSNLYFMLSYEDTRILLDTDYTMYYNSYYKNWKSEIIRMNNIINSTNIHNGYLTGHKRLVDNVYQVEYSNGVTLVINYGNSIYFDTLTGLSVRPNWFTVLEGGM